MNVVEVMARLSGNASGMVSAFKQAAAAAQEYKERVKAATSDAIDGAAAAAKAQEAGKHAGGGFVSGFKGGIAALGVAAAAAGLGGYVKEAMEASDATDKFKSTMNFAGIDTKAIDAATKAAQNYADQTVYDLPTIQKTMAQLASNGIKDYKGLTTAAGNLNAVAGGNAETFKSVSMVMSQTAGAGKLTAENWNQLADAIPGASGPIQKALKDAGAYTGNFREAMEKGEITADEFNKAVSQLGNKPVAVEAAKSTKTFEGAIGSLQATLVGGLTGALNMMKPAITGAINLLTKGLGGAFSWVGNAVRGLGAILGKGDFTGALREAFNVEEDSPLVGALLKVREQALGLGKAARQGMADFISGFREGVDSIYGSQSALAHWGAAAYTAVQTVKGGFTAMFAAYKAGDGDITSSGFAGVMERIGMTARTVTGGISAMFAAYKAGDGDVTSSGFAGLMERVGGGLREGTRGIVAFFAAFKAGDGDVTSSGFPGFMEKLGGAARQVTDVVGGMFKDLGPTVGALLPQIVGLWQAFSPLNIILGAVAPMLPTIVQLFTSLANTLGGALSSVLGVAVPMLMQLSGVITQGLGTVLATVVPVAVQMVAMLASTMATLVPIIMPIITTVIGLATSLMTQLMPIIVNLVSAVLPPVVTIFGAILAAIGPVVSTIAAVLVPVIQALMPVVVTVFSVISSVVQSAMQIVMGIIQVVTGIITGNWGQVWNGIKNVFSGVWNTIVALVRGALQIVGQIVLSGLQLIGTWTLTVLGNVGRFFADAWRNITTGVSGFISGFVKFFQDLPGKAVNALSGLAGQMLTVGQNVVQGLIDGARGMIDRAVQAVKDVGGSMLKGIQDFLGIHSPSREFMKIGNWVTIGLAEGVKKGGGAAVKAVKGVASKLTAAADAHFKKRDSLLKQVRNYTGAVNTAEGAKAAGAQAARNASLRKQAAAELATGRLLDRQAALVNANAKRAGQLAQKRADLAARLKNAEKSLKDKITVRNKKAVDVSNKLQDEFDLGQLVGFSAKDMVVQTKMIGDRIRKFGDKIAALKKAGLSAAMIDEVSALGSTNGTIMADQLLRGGKGVISQMNSAYAGIKTQSDRTGNMVADSLYKAGIDGARGLVRGLTGNYKAVDAAARALATRVAGQVRRALGIKSPSRVFMAIGRFVTDGLGIGIDKGQADAVNSMAATAKAVTDAAQISVPQVPDIAKALSLPTLEQTVALKFTGTSPVEAVKNLAANLQAQGAPAQMLAYNQQAMSGPVPQEPRVEVNLTALVENPFGEGYLEAKVVEISEKSSAKALTLTARAARARRGVGVGG